MPIPLGIIFSSTQIGKASQSHSQLNDLKPRKEGWLFGEFSLTWGKWLLCQIRRRKKRYTISKDDRLPGLVISYGEQLNWASNFGYHSLRVIGLILATPSDFLTMHNIFLKQHEARRDLGKTKINLMIWMQFPIPRTVLQNHRIERFHMKWIKYFGHWRIEEELMNLLKIGLFV